MSWFTDLIVYYDLDTGDPNLLVTMINLFGFIFMLYFMLEGFFILKQAIISNK